jgi:predicted ATPase
MRIDWLEIQSPWKNLGGLKIDFSEERDITVLIGRNGSAKSNLLEAIITIFRNIDLDEPAAFGYEIHYIIHGKRVVIVAEPDRQPKCKLEDKSISLTTLRNHWTPKYVVGYYSGVSDRFDELFRKHDRRALDDTLKPARNEESPEKLNFRRFICARPEHGLFALLSFYFSDDKEVVRFLKARPRIEGFDSALLVIRKPGWAKANSSSDDFWDAQGPVRELLERIRRYSLVPFARSITVQPDFRRREKREVVYLYLPDLQALRALAKDYDQDPRALFQALDTMRLSDLLEDIRVRVKVSGSKGPIHTRQLSEGEQQLLTVLGLMRFTRNEGSLYILDEPDTHLNPAWGLEYLDYLRKVGGIHRNSHTMLATHDPLLVAGLRREEIRILSRSVEGHIVASMPEESPRGMGVASVLTSPLYGLESQLDPFSLRVLKRIYEVSLEERGSKRTRYLRRLRRLIPSLEMAESSPDPYRNIARDAYEIALKRAINSPNSTIERKIIVDNLASKLYDDAGGTK